MITQRPISQSFVSGGLLDHAFRIVRPRCDRPFNALFLTPKSSAQPPKSLSPLQQSLGAFPGCAEKLEGNYRHHRTVVPQFLENLGMKLGFIKMNENVPPPYALTFRSSIHSASPKEFEIERTSKSMNFVRGILDENERGMMGGSQLSRYGVERNADVVHIKLMRNNTFVTVTDSKGNKKAGASSGCLSEMKGGPKASRYAAEATAEHVGRVARNLGLKSVVMKVNGFTYFKKKKQAILSFREGYTHSRGDQNPIVYIEDTTRRPHNGCRLRKKRRV